MVQFIASDIDPLDQHTGNNVEDDVIIKTEKHDGNQHSSSNRKSKRLFDKPTNGDNIQNVFKIYIIFSLIVQGGDSHPGDHQVIPPVIARNRLFGANLVGKYFPRLVPFGPFGFYENFYFNS